MTRATAAIDADDSVTGLGQALVPRHPRASSALVNPMPLLIRAALVATALSASPALQHPTIHYGRDAKTFVAADLRYDDGSVNKPGTAAYYKSFGFRERSPSALTHARGRAAASHEDDSTSIKPGEVARERIKKKSLVMIFSRHTVRHSTLTGSVANRARNVSKRQKFMRNVNGVKKLFGWD